MSDTDGVIDRAKVERALDLLRAEYFGARTVKDPMHSAHEGAAIIKEEYDELWDVVKQRSWNADELRSEAVDLGAMVIAFLVEVCDG